MADQKTPAAVAAERIVDAVPTPDPFSESERAHYVAEWTAIISQATLDACEQAAPRVRAEERELGMRRAARYAAQAFAWQAFAASHGCNPQARVRASVRCERLSRGEPAFTTPRAFGRKP